VRSRLIQIGRYGRFSCCSRKRGSYFGVELFHLVQFDAEAVLVAKAAYRGEGFGNTSGTDFFSLYRDSVITPLRIRVSTSSTTGRNPQLWFHINSAARLSESPVQQTLTSFRDHRGREGDLSREGVSGS
jgi:hypothetical protein